MTSSAKQMFKELDYDIYEETRAKIIYRLIDHFIEFDRKRGVVEVYKKVYSSGEISKEPFPIVSAEVKAINKQIEELGRK